MISERNGRKQKTVSIVPTWQRIVVGCLGASIAVAPPLWTRWATSQTEGLPLLSIVKGIDVALIIAWLASVVLAAIIEEDEIYKPLMTSIGIPGLLVSAAVGLQSVN
jgi:hypothetical protein